MEGRGVDLGRRLLADERALIVVAAFLASAAVGESMARVVELGKPPPFGLAVFLLALLTTVPLALLGRVGSVVAVTLACLLSVVAFHLLSLAGFATEVVVLYRFGRLGPPGPWTQLWACLLGAPWLISALGTPNPLASEAGTLTLFLAVAGPVA
ncbi:MAG TPA: hypothetical protein VGP46_03735, partial [Acidimicrobiales bacterium]|nr:hypothetical protein [Acidimicrobiales bacterium]